MKKLFTLLFVLSISLISVKAQDIPKRASQIFIHNDKTEAENFTYVSKYLISEDIEIANRDKELGTISTAVYSPSKTSPMILIFFCQDNIIRVSGKFKLGSDLDFGGVIAKDNLSKIENRGMKGSPFGKTFEAMNKVAKSLGSEISYK